MTERIPILEVDKIIERCYDLEEENKELKRYVKELQEKLLARDVALGQCCSTKYG